MRKKKNTGLGRGISALIPDFESPGGDDVFVMCPIDAILPNKYQPRTIFDPEELENLKNSIAEQGILQPLLVRNLDGSYELIAGERRLRAAKEAKLTHVPVFIRNLSDEQMLEFSIIENIQRENLNVLEEAEAYHRLIQEFSYTQEKVAQKIGKNRSTIANLLRLRGLPDIIKQALVREDISMGHARALLGVTDGDEQVRLFNIVMQKKLSVRETEKLVNRAKKNLGPAAGKKPPPDHGHLEEISTRLSQSIRSPVQIKKTGAGGNSGKIEIKFKTRDEFNHLVEVLSSIP